LKVAVGIGTLEAKAERRTGRTVLPTPPLFSGDRRPLPGRSLTKRTTALAEASISMKSL
jgi:hypothetical protein